MRPPLTAWAPGRINLIGEHTDYSGGLAMPAAIELGVRVTVESVADGSRSLAALRSCPAVRGGRLRAAERGLGAIRPGRRARARWTRAPPGRSRRDDRFRPAGGRRPVLVGGARGWHRARALRGRGARARAARARAGLPPRRGARGRRAVRVLDQAAWRARTGRHGDRARLRHRSSTVVSRCRPAPPSSSSTRASPARSRRRGTQRAGTSSSARSPCSASSARRRPAPPRRLAREPLRRRLRHVVSENARVTAFATRVGRRPCHRRTV